MPRELQHAAKKEINTKSFDRKREKSKVAIVEQIGQMNWAMMHENLKRFQFKIQVRHEGET